MKETDESKLAGLLNVIQWSKYQEDLDRDSAEIRDLIKKIVNKPDLSNLKSVPTVKELYPISTDDSWDEDDSWASS